MNKILPNPHKLVVTQGVLSFLKDTETPTSLFYDTLLETYEAQEDENLNGGNDKRFFSFMLAGQKFFVAENEVGGLTAMLPEEY